VSDESRRGWKQLAATGVGVPIVIGLIIWTSGTHSFKHNGQYNTTVHNIFTYGVPLIIVLVVLSLYRRFRRTQPIANAVSAEPVIFKVHVDVSSGSETTLGDLTVHGHSFELTASAAEEGAGRWFARGADAQVEMTNQLFGLAGSSRQCLAVTFPVGVNTVTLWLLPNDSRLRPTWDALVECGVVSEGMPPD
jgi:hypothetical protein